MKDYKISNAIRHAPFIGIYSDPNSIVSEKKSKSKKSKSIPKPISPSKTKKIRTKPVPRQRVKATAADAPTAAPVPILSPLLEIQAVEPRVKRVQPKPKPRARVKPEPVVPRVVRRPFNLLEPAQRIQLKPRVRRSSVFFKANATKANATKGSPNKTNANETLKKQLLIKGSRVNRMPALNHPLLRMSLKARKAAQLRPLEMIRE